jgi:phage tail-like protein
MSDKLLAQANAVFRFVIEIDGTPEAAFIECTLPILELEVEEVKEGGLNTFVHQLPGQRKSARLILKNGVGKTSLVQWYRETMEGQIKRKSISVRLLDSMRSEVAVWNIENAYPIKWVGPQLQASENSIAIQTLEMACGEVTVA